ncbi:uncharacterized protein CIMG_13697 [Coccidioides immitis RS]|uniref:Uncharacterized protein n=1 Tax=Coccidioides immitis (strain RS) TaxID=246410 RepID=J3KB00_COCIM|nr:uncharacterized protein CIMG_13697 [Coccidioides immitis RS]EAS32250.3 hypothetical protein CIMG_13697 [Coccidioides immitis RS]
MAGEIYFCSGPMDMNPEAGNEVPRDWFCKWEIEDSLSADHAPIVVARAAGACRLADLRACCMVDRWMDGMVDRFG